MSSIPRTTKTEPTEATFTTVPSAAVSTFEKSGTSTGNVAREALVPLTSTAPALRVYLPGFRPSLKEARKEPSAPTARFVVCSVQAASFPSSATALAATETFTVFPAPACAVVRPLASPRTSPRSAVPPSATLRYETWSAVAKSWRGCLKRARAAVSFGSSSASFTRCPSFIR